jgi:hypothetical protein
MQNITRFHMNTYLAMIDHRFCCRALIFYHYYFGGDILQSDISCSNISCGNVLPCDILHSDISCKDILHSDIS